MKNLLLRVAIALPAAIAMAGLLITSYAWPGAGSVFGVYTPEPPDEDEWDWAA